MFTATPVFQPSDGSLQMNWSNRGIALMEPDWAIPSEDADLARVVSDNSVKVENHPLIDLPSEIARLPVVVRC